MNTDLVRRAREEVDALRLMSYHGVSATSLWFADLTEDDVREIRNLIDELASFIEDQ